MKSSHPLPQSTREAAIPIDRVPAVLVYIKKEDKDQLNQVFINFTHKYALRSFAKPVPGLPPKAPQQFTTEKPSLLNHTLKLPDKRLYLFLAGDIKSMPSVKCDQIPGWLSAL